MKIFHIQDDQGILRLLYLDTLQYRPHVLDLGNRQQRVQRADRLFLSEKKLHIHCRTVLHTWVGISPPGLIKTY